VKTILVIEIDHNKPLPDKAEEIAGQRIYGWLYSQGVQAGVNSRVWYELKEDHVPAN
jgi:hypothetical protein